MPPKDRVGSDKRSNFGKGASSDGLTSNRKSTTLIVGQPESSATELGLVTRPNESALLNGLAASQRYANRGDEGALF